MSQFLTMFTLIFSATLLSVITFDVVQCKSVSTGLPRIPDGMTIHKVIATWEEANQRCQSEGAVIASPINENLRNVMYSLIGETPYFIGIKGSNITAERGISLSNITTEVMDMIKQNNSSTDSCLSMDQNSIRVVSCCTRLPFICYKGQIEDSTTTKEIEEEEVSTETAVQVPSKIHCGTKDEEYKPFNSTGSCYKIHLEKKLWEDAAGICAYEGGYLAIVNDYAEAEVIKSLAFPPDMKWYVYVGLRNYGPQNGWRNIRGYPVDEIYNNWIDGTGLKSPKYCCGLLKYTGQLDWDSCYENEHAFLCEKYIKYN